MLNRITCVYYQRESAAKREASLKLLLFRGTVPDSACLYGVSELYKVSCEFRSVFVLREI